MYHVGIMNTSNIFKDWLEPEEVKKFLVIPGERLLLAIREHYEPLIIRLLEIAGAALLVSIISAAGSFFLLHSLSLSLLLFSTILLLGSGLVLREIMHWYFHLYVITTKKIIEVSYSPLTSELSNSVLLDQLRCTEIDAELTGFISEFLDMGNVTITFDRPTHQTEFTLKNIRSPRKIANYLSSHLHSGEKDNPNQIWFKMPKTNTYQFFEERNHVPVTN